MSAFFSSRPDAVTTNIRQRAQSALSALNLHWAGVALLAAINLYLLVQMGFAWQRARNQNADAFAAQQVALKTAQIQAKPLEGLDVKLAKANAESDKFYHERLPANYSELASEFGAVAKKDGVRLTRVQYSQAPVVGDAAGQLTEVRMDASLSGDYRPMVLFLNGLERDRVFFLISGVTLTGQQTGLVNLRIRVTTYLSGVGSEQEALRVSVGDPADGTGAAAALDAATASRKGGTR